MNRKKVEEPLEVYKMQDGTPTPFMVLVEKINPSGVSTVQDVGQNILSGLSQAVPHTPSSGLLASEHCKQLGAFRRSQGLVSEPEWYACLGVLAHCEDGADLAQKWSVGHPNYSESETAKKFEQARTRSGPTTCQRFKDIAPKGCEGCPHAITSPIQLGKSASTITPPSIASEIEKKPWLPEGFIWGPNMQIMAEVPDPVADPGENKRILVTVCKHPFYIASIREDETLGVSGDKTVLIFHRTPHMPWKSFIIHRATIDSANWKSALSGKGVSCCYGMDKLFKKLLTTWIDGKNEMEKNDVCYNSFGWKDDDTSFVLGRKRYTKDKVFPASGTAQVELLADKLRPNLKGSFREWRALINKLFAPGCEPQSFAALSSFSSVLMKFVCAPAEGGCILSLVSSGSGKGKSTSIAAVESVWGINNCLRLGDTASDVAKFKSMGN